MAMKQEDFDIFSKFVALKFRKPGIERVKIECPLCGMEKWAMDGPVIMLHYNEGTAVVSGGGAPFAIMTCLNCYYVRSFAWLPIKAICQSTG